MPFTVITWNIYHGNIGPQTPAQRIQWIANIAALNSIDVVCLQEVPQSLLDTTVVDGPPGPLSGVMAALADPSMNAFLNAYSVVQVYSENSTLGPQATTTADGYLYLIRNASVPIFNFTVPYQYDPAYFSSPYGTYYRPPVQLNVQTASGTQFLVMNWHAETGPAAGISLDILNARLGPAVHRPHVTIVAGDFNTRGDFAGVFYDGPNFRGWDNVVARYPSRTHGLQVWGLDHILVSANATPILANTLDVTSDAYHFPVAARIG